MAQAKKAQVFIEVNGSQADQIMKILQNDARKLKKELDDLEKQGKSNTKEFKDKSKLYQSMHNAQVQNIKDIKRVEDAMKNLSSTTTNDLRRALAAGRRELNKMFADSPGREKLIKDLKRIQAQIDKNTGVASKNTRVWSTALRNLVAYTGLFSAFSQAKTYIEDTLGALTKMSDKLADIRKVSGLTSNDIKSLSKELSKTDTRTSQNEMLGIAYQGAKLGIGEYGVEGLAGFTRAANQVNVALKEDLGDEALTALSKFTENMGLIKQYGIEDAMLKAGSAMFKLSATSTATSANIVEFTKRMMASGKAAGITADQLLALGSSADSMGLMPEVAATAMSRFVTAMQTNHNLIEKKLGIPKGVINSYYEQGKAMDAIVLILDKLRGKNMNQLSFIWKDLGSEDGARLKNVITAMTNQLPMLQQHLLTSAQAFREGTAVTQEYNIQQNTANALIERASNLWAKKFVNEENVDVVHEMAKAWYDVTVQLTRSETFLEGVRLIFWTLKIAVQALCAVLPALVFMLGGMGLARATLLAYEATKSLVAGTWAMVSAAWGADRAWGKLNATMKVNVIGFVIGSLLSLAFYLKSVSQRTVEASGYMKGFSNSLRDLNAQTDLESRKLKTLFENIRKAKEGTQQRKNLVATFNKQYGQYLGYMLKEASTADDIYRAYARVNQALRGKLALEGQQKDYSKYVTPALALASQRWADVDQARVGNKRFGAVNSDVIKNLTQAMAAKGTSANSVLNAFLRQYSGWNQNKINDEVWVANHGQKSYANSQKVARDTTATSLQRDRAYIYIVSQAIRSELSAINRERKVEAKWKSEQKAQAAYLATNETKPGSLDNDAPDKEAIKAAKAEERERNRVHREEVKSKRDELQEAEKQATAIISTIEEYYKLQDTAIEQLVADGKLTRSEADAILLSQKKRLNIMLQQARLAIAGQQNNFEELRTKGMGAGFDQVDFGEQSQKALNDVRKVDVVKAHTTLAKFDGDKEADSGATMDKIRKNAAQNKLEAARIEAQQAEKIKNIILQEDYQGKAEKDSYKDFVDLGLVKAVENFFSSQKPTADKDGGVSVTASAMPYRFKLMTRQFRAQGNQNYQRNMNSKRTVERDGQMVNEGDQNAKDWFREFTTTGYTDRQGNEHTAAEWLPIIDVQAMQDDVEKIKAFYEKLQQADDAYYEASKKNYDREKKLAEERWNRSDEGKADVAKTRQLDREQRVQKMNLADQGTVWQQVGLGDTISLTDVGMAKAMQEYNAAQQRYAMTKQFYDDEQLILEAQQQAEEAALALSEQIADRIQQRVDRLQSTLDPIKDFAQTMGEAFVTMADDAKEGRNMLQRAAADMVKAYAQMTIKMLAQQVTQRVQRALFHKQMEKLEKKHNTTLAKSAEQGGKEQLSATETLKEGIVSVTEQANSKTKALADKKAADDKQQTVQETQGGVFAGIAQGAARIIGKLGWFGIPLIAVIQALLMGLLNKALSKLGGGASSETASTNTKLVTGMLTYDRGNVQEFRGVDDGQSFPVLGDDGRVYAATDAAQLQTGIVSRPLLTTVNGRPSLVGERGPEMVIGRETTSAMMMSRPDLLREIVRFDRNRTRATVQTFDRGNVGSFASGGGSLQQSAVMSQSDGASQSAPAPLMDADTLAALQSLAPTLAALTEQLKQPIRAKMDMWGRDGAYEQMDRAQKFMKRYK